MTGAGGRTVERVVVERDGAREEYTADVVVVSGGAINSAALLLASANDDHPDGLGNSSGMVGRNLMLHNNSSLIAISQDAQPDDVPEDARDQRLLLRRRRVGLPARRDADARQERRRTRSSLDAPDADDPADLAAHSLDFWLTTEDLPLPDNRVDARRRRSASRSRYTPTNLEAHDRLKAKFRSLLDAMRCQDEVIGRHTYLGGRLGISGVAHQNGTTRFGTDPATSVLDVDCRLHDVDNVYVVDAELLRVELGGQPDADDHRQRPAGRRPPRRSPRPDAGRYGLARCRANRRSGHDDEHALVAALRAGDEEAFGQLVDRYYAVMLRVARQYVATKEAAEDVVQETFLGVIQGIDRFEARSSLRTWMFRILVNRAKTRGEREGRTRPFSALRRAGRRRAGGRPRPLRSATGGGPGSGAPRRRAITSPTPVCWPPSWAPADAMRSPRCPSPQRTVLELRDVQGFSAAEVCELLDISEANQRVLLHRGRSKARALARALPRRPGGGELMRQPEVRCVEFVESVTDWMEGALDDDDRLRARGAPRDLPALHRVPAPSCAWRPRSSGRAPAPAEAPPPAARAALLAAFRSAAAQRLTTIGQGRQTVPT